MAAGSGSRMGNQTNDKILENIGNSNAFRMCLPFVKIQQISNVVIVFRDQKQKERLESEINQFATSSKASFSSSKVVRRRFCQKWTGCSSPSCKFAHIHDYARPLIRTETIAQMIDEVEKNIPIAVARPATNTIRKKISGSTHVHTKTLDRSQLWEMELLSQHH